MFGLGNGQRHALASLARTTKLLGDFSLNVSLNGSLGPDNLNVDLKFKNKLKVQINTIKPCLINNSIEARHGHDHQHKKLG